ncbi:hypothetical protein ABZ215_13420 [Amycolatopsis sp. NPDC006131]|uniref:hypothetical protein n=1 Tax=Amycolatopsis sp. NPDC006131 TaxID=3156731 RepID=UPI00339F6F90
MSHEPTDEELVHAMHALGKRLATLVSVYGQVGSFEAVPGPEMLRAVATANDQLAAALRARADQIDAPVLDGYLTDQVPALPRR